MSEYDAVIAHEHYPARGGGEIVADELARVFDAPIVTGWLKDSAYSDHEPIEILERTPLDPLRRWFGNPLVRDAFYMFAWESVPTLREYDVVIQSGNAPTWYVPDDDQVVVKYNHSPPRNPFDLFWRDQSHTANGWDLVNPGYVVDRLYKKAARQMWKNRTSEVDLWVCNSELVAKRTRKYLGVPEEQMTVVYPPVNVDQYTPTGEDGDYYVALSRLEPSKHMDLIIRAFDHVDAQLYVAGSGNERAQIEALAGARDNVEYLGYVDEQTKRDLFENARASIFAAANEDFGIVPIESLAAGTPVIGVRDGFTEYQIREGENGVLFDRTEEDLAAAIQRFEREGVAWSASQLHQYSQQFSVERFHDEMRRVVDVAVRDAQLSADIGVPVGQEVDADD